MATLGNDRLPLLPSTSRPDLELLAGMGERMTPPADERELTWLRIVEEHVRLENQHDLDRIPATGRQVEIPICAIFTFDQRDRLAGEKIYYDRASLLQQLGLFHEPTSPLGQFITVISHPVTVGRAFGRMLVGLKSPG